MPPRQAALFLDVKAMADIDTPETPETIESGAAAGSQRKQAFGSRGLPRLWRCRHVALPQRQPLRR
jgi:hypothetical protein